MPGSMAHIRCNSERSQPEERENNSNAVIKQLKNKYYFLLILSLVRYMARMTLKKKLVS